jgi:biopolymer transport protein ExbD
MKAAVESAGGGAAAGALSVQPGEIRYKRRKRHRRRRREKKSMMIWGVCFAGVMLALLVLFILELTKGAEHILPPPIETPQAAPAPPPPADNP